MGKRFDEYFGDLEPLIDDEVEETKEGAREVLGGYDSQPDPRIVALAIWGIYAAARGSLVTNAEDTIVGHVGDGWEAQIGTAVPPAVASPASEFLIGVDRLYLGQYVTDPQVIQSATRNLVELYTEGGYPIGTGTSVDAFVSRVGGTFNELSTWKTRQIIDTSVTRTRNWSRVFNMRHTALLSYQIVGPIDQKTCDWCEGMVGREFEVEKTYNRLQEAVGAGEANLGTTCPFLTGWGDPEQVAQATDAELQDAGVELPPYHPSCRHEPVYTGAKAIYWRHIGQILRARVINRRRAA